MKSAVKGLRYLGNFTYSDQNCGEIKPKYLLPYMKSFQNTQRKIGNLRLEYEYEIEYKYEFSISFCRFYIVASHTNLTPEASFFTGKQHIRVRLTFLE